MRHEFHGHVCLYCGVNIANSGYSEQCPARPGVRGYSKQRPAKQSVPSDDELPANAQRCYRCQQLVVPFIDNTVIGGGTAVGMRMPNGMILVNQQPPKTMLTAHCPRCGVILHDEWVSNFNRQSEEEDFKVGFLVFVSIFGGLGLIAYFAWLAS